MKLNIDGVITELSEEEEALYNPEIPTISDDSGGWNLYKTYTADGSDSGFEWRTGFLTFKECQEVKIVFRDVVPNATTNLNVGIRFKGYESVSAHIGFQQVNGFSSGYYHYNEFIISRIKNGVKEMLLRARLLV